MLRRIIGALALTLALVAGLAAVSHLYAQRASGTDGMTDMMSMVEHCPMMSAMQESPQTALEHREELGLTDPQAQRLEVLHEGAEQARTRSMERMRALHNEIAVATEGGAFDEAVVRGAFDRMGSLHRDMGMAMLRTRHDVRQILSPEQLEKLSELGGGMMHMHGMMRMMGGMDMENWPMMQGGMMRPMDEMRMPGPAQRSTQG